MPLSMQQQLHVYRPPASIVHRFCTKLQATLSSHEQWILKPPVHFSTLNVQRGTIIAGGMPVGVPIVGIAMPGTPMPGTPIPVRSINIVLDMQNSFPGLTVRGAKAAGARQEAIPEARPS